MKLGHFLEIPVDTDRNRRKPILVENERISLNINPVTLTDGIAETLPTPVGTDIKLMRRVVTNTPEFHAVDNLGFVHPRSPRIVPLTPVVVKMHQQHLRQNWIVARVVPGNLF